MPQITTSLTAARAARLLFVACATAGLAGCILPAKMRGMNDLPVDPKSPVAQEVINASKHPGPYPKFADIPPTPTDVRPPQAWRAAVLDLKAKKAVLDAQVADLPPPATDTEAFAAQKRGQAESDLRAGAPDAAQQTEAYARTLRERATPPPPPK